MFKQIHPWAGVFTSIWLIFTMDLGITYMDGLYMSLLLMAEIRGSPVEVGSIYLMIYRILHIPGPRWLFGLLPPWQYHVKKSSHCTPMNFE